MCRGIVEVVALLTWRAHPHSSDLVINCRKVEKETFMNLCDFLGIKYIMEYNREIPIRFKLYMIINEINTTLLLKR